MIALFILFTVLVVIGGILVWNFKYLLDWETGVLEGHSSPLELGETRSITYRAVAKKKRVLSELAISAELKVEEVVYYNQGTDRRRAASELYLGPISVNQQPDDRAVVLTGFVHIPAHLPPSLDLSNNNVNWTIEIRLDPDQGTQLENSFEILVMPRVREQGTEPDFIERRAMDDGSGLLPPTPGNFLEG